MALARTYLTVNGKIRSEHRSGEARSRDFLHDALGSVVTVYQNNSFVADGSYSCLGRLESGSWNIAAQGYRFSWGGGHGYRQTGLEWSSTYVRARHHAFMSGSWTTVDPLWPNEMPYGYVYGMAMSAVDYWGMKQGLPRFFTDPISKQSSGNRVNPYGPDPFPFRTGLKPFSTSPNAKKPAKSFIGPQKPYDDPFSLDKLLNPPRREPIGPPYEAPSPLPFWPLELRPPCGKPKDPNCEHEFSRRTAQLENERDRCVALCAAGWGTAAAGGCSAVCVAFPPLCLPCFAAAAVGGGLCAVSCYDWFDQQMRELDIWYMYC